MIECIKEFRSELQHLIFQLPEMDGEVALNAGVKINLSRSILGVALHIARHRIRHHEMECIDRLGTARPCGEDDAVEIIRTRRKTCVKAIDSEGIERRSGIHQIRTRIRMAISDIIEADRNSVGSS